LQPEIRGTKDRPGIFAALSGFLQVIINIKKAGGNEGRRFLLCWHGDRLADSADSLKPCALRVPSCRRAGLDRIRSASFRKRAPAEQKVKVEFPELSYLEVRGTQPKLGVVLSSGTVFRKTSSGIPQIEPTYLNPLS
jgi:hypothetical protein